MIRPRCNALAVQKCVAKRNKKSEQICNRPTVQGKYCGYHCRKKVPKRKVKTCKREDAVSRISRWWKICVKHSTLKLDALYSEFLVCGEDSWADIPFCFRYNITTNEWWDIRFLCNHFAQLLNNQDMTVPTPTYPNNPFTRKPYSPEELRCFFQRVITLKLKVNVALKRFRDAPLLSLYRAVQRKQLHIAQKKMSKYFSKSLRFKLVKQTDSQCNFIGHWVRRSMQLSEFEKAYRNWIKTPVYIGGPKGELVFNPVKDFRWTVVWRLPDESWSVVSDNTAVTV
jgi:hypothetical protein